MSGIGKQAITFAVETKNGVVARIGRTCMAVPEIKFRGGKIKWMEDNYKETADGKESGIWER